MGKKAMNIQEAIEAARPGATGQNETTGSLFQVDNNGRIHFKTTLLTRDFLDNTWQVVNTKPEIEVGDVVHHEDCPPDTSCIITAKERKSAATAKNSKEGCICMSGLSGFTLLRKGKRLVFEGVRLEKISELVVPIFKHVSEAIDFQDLHKTGKTYEMTLTEK
jgi:hypothetical protein